MILLHKEQDVAEVAPLNLQNSYVENGKVYAANVCVSDFDIVFWLYYVGDNSYDWDILQILAQETIVVPNPSASLHTRNKFYAHSKLRSAGLRTADFCMFPASDSEIHAARLAHWGNTLIKPVLGDFGQGICRVNDKQTFVDTVAYAQSFSKYPLQIFCERFEENDISRWISVTVIDGQAIFGYRKHPSAFVDGWKVYDATRKGGNAYYVDIFGTEVAALATQAAKALNCDIVGFDFIYSER